MVCNISRARSGFPAHTWQIHAEALELFLQATEILLHLLLRFVRVMVEGGAERHHCISDRRHARARLLIKRRWHHRGHVSVTGRAEGKEAFDVCGGPFATQHRSNGGRVDVRGTEDLQHVLRPAHFLEHVIAVHCAHWPVATLRSHWGLLKGVFDERRVQQQLLCALFANLPALVNLVYEARDERLHKLPAKKLEVDLRQILRHRLELRGQALRDLPDEGAIVADFLTELRPIRPRHLRERLVEVGTYGLHEHLIGAAHSVPEVLLLARESDTVLEGGVDRLGQFLGELR
mmetsp:Transcript_41107/g.113284  ORF Transcript_41107/g.113284 Transcript_41107/m.113284 type:complete len:290 (+) Transcript_41107:142-1011(+)